MAANLKLYELTGSPNNVKVRIGLGYKGLEYEREPIELDGFPGDRERVIALSTQPRLPVLQHGETVLFDSGAILRYLDANFPDTPRLYSSDYEMLGRIEELELYARGPMGEPVGMIFGQAFAPAPDPDVCRAASEKMNAVTAKLEGLLSESEFLLGGAPTGADCALAPSVALAMLPAAAAAAHPIAAMFHEHFHLGDGRERTVAWTKKMLAYDAESAKLG